MTFLFFICMLILFVNIIAMPYSPHFTHQDFSSFQLDSFNENFDELLNFQNQPFIQHLIDISSHSTSVHSHFNVQSGNFTCQSLPSTYTPTMMCSGIVDYSFYVPSTQSLLTMEALVRQNVARAVPFLGAPCLSDIKKLACANVYHPCTSNHASPLPYQRPCKSLCQATVDPQGSCMGRLTTLHMAPDCSALDPSTGLSVYDPSEDPSLCNVLPAAQHALTVGYPSEPYVGSVCKGVVEETYLPASSTLDPTGVIAPLLPPYVAQNMIEKVTTGLANRVPLSMPSPCLSTQRRMLCALKFLRPETVHTLDGLFGAGNVVLPSFPNTSICTDYNQACASTLLTVVPSLRMNCSAHAFGSTRLFPNRPQTITALNLAPPTAPPHIVQLQTTPNSLPNASLVLQTECPLFMAVPDEPDNPNTFWIPTTGCAIACPGFSTPEQFQLAWVTDFVLWIIHLALLAFCVFNVYLQPSGKRNISVLIWIGVVSIFTITEITMFIISWDDIERITCETNTTWYVRTQALASKYATACAFSAVSELLYQFFTLFVMLSMHFEIWFRIVWEMKDLFYARLFYFYFVGLIILANLLVVFLVGDPQLEPKFSANTLCFWSSYDPELNFHIRTIPEFVYMCSTYLLIFHYTFTFFRVTLNAQKGNERTMKKFSKMWKSYRTLFLFTIQFSLQSPAMIGYLEWYILTNQEPLYQQASEEWSKCVFKNFHRASDRSYMDVCGGRPKAGVPFVLLYLFQMLLVCQDFCIVLATLNSESKKFWWGLLPSFLQTAIMQVGSQCGVCAPLFRLLNSVTPKESSVSMASKKNPQKKSALGFFRLGSSKADSESSSVSSSDRMERGSQSRDNQDSEDSSVSDRQVRAHASESSINLISALGLKMLLYTPLKSTSQGLGSGSEIKDKYRLTDSLGKGLQLNAKICPVDEAEEETVGSGLGSELTNRKGEEGMDEREVEIEAWVRAESEEGVLGLEGGRTEP